jgi:hypothetical protein
MMAQPHPVLLLMVNKQLDTKHETEDYNMKQNDQPRKINTLMMQEKGALISMLQGARTCTPRITISHAVELPPVVESGGLPGRASDGR